MGTDRGRHEPRKGSDTDSDAYKDEFAKDVCAFANASGGDLIYGISDDRGAAAALAPIATESFDSCRRRLLQVMDNHIEPRIAGIRMQSVPIENEGFVLVLRVPASFEGPHRYLVRGRDGIPEHARFVKRNHSQTHDMDYTQLRDAFGRTATLVEKARAFRRERSELLAVPPKSGLAGLYSLPFGGVASFCVHLLPLAGFARGAPLIDIASVYHRHDLSFAMPGGFIPQKQVNMDGLLMTSSPHPQSGEYNWVVRLFRNGAIEHHARAGRFDREVAGAAGYLPAVQISSEIRRICEQLLTHARALGMEGPALLGLTGIATGDYPFRIERNGGHYGNTSADRDFLPLVDRWIDDLAAQPQLDAIVRPMLDEYWQCFGEVRCELYDQVTGDWIMST